MKKNTLNLGLLLLGLSANAVVWQVGPARTYTKPSMVAPLVNDGDTVEIDAGNYIGDACAWSKSNLLLKGVGGRPALKANGIYSMGKGTWVMVGNNNTVENIEFANASVPDQNGAGIRLDGTGLTVRNCYFHHNENSILGGATGDILIEYSEFYLNGYGDGYTHNLYINNANSLTYKFNYSHGCNVGHELKSRADKNYILYNRLMNEATGNASREIDLPNGGLAVIMGNLIQQGPNTSNSGMIGYGLEGFTNPSNPEIYIVNNTIVDQRGFGGVFIGVPSGIDLLKAYNNIFYSTTATFLSGNPVSLDTSNNWICSSSTALGMVDFDNYDYRLTAASPAIDKGIAAGVTSTPNGLIPLTPTMEYSHKSSGVLRTSDAIIDLGAYEYATVTGINGVKTNNLKVFHNSIDRMLMISSNGSQTEKDYVLYDTVGKVVAQYTNISGAMYSLSTNGLANGIYVIRVIESGNVYSQKIMID